MGVLIGEFGLSDGGLPPPVDGAKRIISYVGGVGGESGSLIVAECGLEEAIKYDPASAKSLTTADRGRRHHDTSTLTPAFVHSVR